MAQSNGRKPGHNASPKGFVTSPPVKPEVPTINPLNSSTIAKANSSEVSTIPVSRLYNLYKARIQRQGRATILSQEEYFNVLNEYGVEESLASKASLRLATNPPILIATSGKMASGKDTITKALILKLSEQAHSHVSLSAAMKDEAQEALDRIRSFDDKNGAIEGLFNFNISEYQAEEVVNLVYDFAKAEPNVTTRDRTAWVRSLLQYWATDIRRAQDKNYWTNKTISNIAETIVTGQDVIITDIRVADEVERFQGIGFTIVRLDIDPKVQAERLRGRDGIEIDPKAVNHPNETALDDFKGFNIRVENNDVSVGELVDNIFNLYRA